MVENIYFQRAPWFKKIRAGHVYTEDAYKQHTFLRPVKLENTFPRCKVKVPRGMYIQRMPINNTRFLDL